jgi:diaminohydroxyphosphoribosylaminopyrimidine deaminase / 5-amino-6-(5-phosphoribosylamino)uracil reductase
MREALALAERGRGRTHPNPVVGAVLVAHGRVLARGFHRRAGLPHAEIEALSKRGVRPRGATLYVTMEPCCHHGRTGPCTQAIEAAGVRRVVVGCCDENPLVSGRGVLQLRRAGLQVDVGCLAGECHKQNRAFFCWIRARRPWVTLKVAATLDGFIAGSNQPAWRDPHARFVTGVEARAHARRLRAEHDAVLVGVGTVLADDPRLTVRPTASDRKTLDRHTTSRAAEMDHELRASRRAGTAASEPLRVVLDGHLRTPPSARLMRQVGTTPPLIVGARPPKRARDTATRMARERALRRAGAEVLLLPADRAGRIPTASLLRALGERGIQSLLVEGGSRVHGAFISARLVDSVAFYFAPRLVGTGRPIVEGHGLSWRAPLKLGAFEVRAIGEDVLLLADVLAPGSRRRTHPRE